MASIYIDPPDELEDDNEVNIANIHRSVVNMAKQLNYALNNMDTDNFTEDIAEIIDNLTKEGEEG
jgi:phosphate uptake regulator